MMNDIKTARPIRDIAAEILSDWRKPLPYEAGTEPNVWFGAVPWLRAMFELDKVTDHYGQESADDVIAYFLVNARTWRGETARRVKAELKGMIGR
jgi:hypothetical protein